MGRVGELNHFRVFIKDMVTTIHQVTVENISRLLLGIDQVTNQRKALPAILS
jgi:hypothetical protein